VYTYLVYKNGCKEACINDQIDSATADGIARAASKTPSDYLISHM
jgi:hypothetical protein